MIYIENKSVKRCVLILIGIIAAVYLPWLGFRELRGSEAQSAVIAVEMIASGKPLATTVQGLPVDAFPLHSWLVALFCGFGYPGNYAVRMPSLLAFLLMAVLAGMFAKKYAGNVAGVIAAGMVLTSFISFREINRGSNEPLLALFLALSWFLWYRQARERHNWNTAWIFAFTALIPAIFAGGLQAVLFFYFPLLFLRRPFSVRQRLLSYGHISGLALLTIVVGGWLYLAPSQVITPWSVATVTGITEQPIGYMREILLFPLSCIAYLLPWTFIAWPAFCAAFRPLENDPVPFRFLRTLVLAVFTVSWILPDISARSLLPLLCPLAVLTGMHYEGLVRRHSFNLSKLVCFLRVFIVMITSFGLIAVFLHLTGLVQFTGLPTLILLFFSVAMLICLTMSIALRYRLKNWNFRQKFLLVTGVFFLVYTACYASFHVWLQNHAYRDAGVLRENIPEPEGIVYILQLPGKEPFVECFYLRHRVVRIVNPAADIPPDKEQVYVLAGRRPPILETREWSACSEPVDTAGRYRLTFMPEKLFWFMWRLKLVPKLVVDPEETRILRMYKGVLRPAT